MIVKIYLKINRHAVRAAGTLRKIKIATGYYGSGYFNKQFLKNYLI